jgi:hypothetical protein
VNAVPVASLEQQLLAGDWLRIEDQRQEACDARMQADFPRRFQIDVQIEQALEPIRRLPDSRRLDLPLRWSVVRNLPGCR